MGGVNEKWSLRYVVGPRSIPMNTVMRSVLFARHEKRAQRAHRFCRMIRKRTVTRNSSQLLAGGTQAKALLCRKSRLCFCGCE